MAVAAEPAISEAAAAFADLVINAINGAGAAAANQAFMGQSNRQHLPELDWAHIAGILNYAYPGFTQPKKYDANTVSTLVAEMIAHISGETQGLYYGTLALAGDITALQTMALTIEGQLRQIAAGAASSTALVNLARTVGQLGVTVANDFHASIAHTDAVGAQITGWLAAEEATRARGDVTVLTQANAFSQRLANTITGWLQAEEAARARGDANTLADANAFANQLAATITGWLKAEEATRANADNVLHGQIVNGVQAAEGFATATATAAATSATAKLQAQIQPQLAKINTAIDTCLDPLCDTVTPNAKRLGNLGNLLSQFTDTAFYGLLLAFLAEAVADPHLAAAEIDGTIAPIAGAAAAGLRDLLGV